MEWGFLTLPHILSLIIGIGLICVVHFSVCNLNHEAKTIVLFLISLFPVAGIIYNLIIYHAPLEHLPLNVTEICALIMPFVILFPRKGPANFLLLDVLAGACGLLFNNACESGYFSLTSIFYYFPMLISFGLPILIFTLDFSDLDIKYLPITLGIGVVLYTAIHFINIGINNYCAANNILNWVGDVINVNYMATIYPTTKILKAFYSILPYRFWYMSVGLVVVFIYLVLIYGIHNYVIRVRKTNEMK